MAQITGTTFRGGLFRGVLAGAVVHGVLFLTSGEQTATAQAPCEQGTAVANPGRVCIAANGGDRGRKRGALRSGRDPGSTVR